jgi:UrcA family protein
MKTSQNICKNSTLPAAAMMAGICASLIFGHSARSADLADKPRQQIVRFADLNLSSPDGAAALYRRIHAAAVNDCGDVDARDFARIAATKTCIAHAVTQALVAVNNPVVTDRYLAKTERGALHLADTRMR